MNIITTLKKEIEKGNLLVDANGNCLNSEKVKKAAKREYLALVREGKLDMEQVTFPEYLNEYTYDCVSTQSIIDIISASAALSKEKEEEELEEEELEEEEEEEKEEPEEEEETETEPEPDEEPKKKGIFGW